MVFNFKQEEPSIIKVIGVGGGGSNAVTHMYKQGIIGVDFAICNTDSQAMELSPVPTRIQLGPSVSAGLGAGSQPQRGKQACLECCYLPIKVMTKRHQRLLKRDFHLLPNQCP